MNTRSHWASHAIEALSKGETCKITPHGNSMTPRIKSGATVTLTPFTGGTIEVGDVVLVKVKGTVYLHLVKAIKGKGENTEYLIGNNHGGLNGWTSRVSVYGKATEIVQP